MNVTLYTNSSENYRIDKVTTLVASYTCTLKNDTSVENPVILIASSSNLSGINYMYIQEYGRYYFVTDIVSVKNGLWEISGHVDVLYTYKSGILACSATLKRQENLFNLYLDDPEFKTYNNSDIVTKVFTGGNGLKKNMDYILVVAGG